MKKSPNKKMLVALIGVCIVTCVIAITVFFFGLKTRLDKAHRPPRSLQTQQ